jgi:hypothetical protein
MTILETILGGGAKSIGDLIKTVVGTFKLSPEAKLEFEKQLAENDFKLKQIDAELEAKLANAASANIQAEAGSGDKYTSRARPTFMYVFNFILLWNYVAVPIFRQAPVDFPDSLMWLGGSAILGYTGARSWEKIVGKK